MPPVVDRNAEFAAYRDFLNQVAAQQRLDPTRGIFGEDMTAPAEPAWEDPGKARAANEFNAEAAGYRDFLNQVAMQQANPGGQYEPSDFASGPGEAIDFWEGGGPGGGQAQAPVGPPRDGGAAGTGTGPAARQPSASYQPPGVRGGKFEPGGIRMPWQR